MYVNGDTLHRMWVWKQFSLVAFELGFRAVSEDPNSDKMTVNDNCRDQSTVEYSTQDRNVCTL
jgi:hypothetical protein